MNNTRKQTGSVLLEVLIAAVIGGISILTISKLQASIMINNVAAQQKNQARMLAQAKMEEMRNFSSLQQYDNIAATASVIHKDSKDYHRSETIQHVTEPHYKVINVRVNWEGNDRKNKTVILSSVVSKHDPSMVGYLFKAKSGPSQGDFVPTPKPKGQTTYDPNAALDLANRSLPSIRQELRKSIYNNMPKQDVKQVITQMVTDVYLQGHPYGSEYDAIVGAAADNCAKILGY